MPGRAVESVLVSGVTGSGKYMPHADAGSVLKRLPHTAHVWAHAHLNPTENFARAALARGGLHRFPFMFPFGTIRVTEHCFYNAPAICGTGDCGFIKVRIHRTYHEYAFSLKAL